MRSTRKVTWKVLPQSWSWMLNKTVLATLSEEVAEQPADPNECRAYSGNEYSFCSDEESERDVLTPSMKPKSVILDDAELLQGIAFRGEVQLDEVGSEDWDPVEVDLLLEELRDIPVTPEKKGKSSKVSGRDKDPGKGENTQLKGIAFRGEVQLDEVIHKPGVVDSPVEAGNYSEMTPSPYIKYLEPTRHNTDTN
ncbi:UNVERIFIED_CONTAM: hypothetical protein FKN15_034521 [Acipenser sinensis]